MNSCSVIIVSKQDGQQLFVAIEAVLMQKQLLELLIVDNGNTPATISRLQQRTLSEPRLKIISGHGDVGFVKGCNIGAKRATGEVLLFLKGDYLLSPDAITDLSATLNSQKNIMLVGGRVQCADGVYLDDFHQQIITPKSVFLEMVRFKKPAKNPIDTKPFEAATINSACMCVRAVDFKKLGGFDGAFFPQAEEVDFALRVEQIGGRVFCVPAVVSTLMPQNFNNNIDKKSVAISRWHEGRNLISYFNKFFAGHQPFGALFLLNILIVIRSIFRMILAVSLSAKTTNYIATKRLMFLASGIVDIEKNDQLAKKIVLVTGATSQIGLCVVRRLIASGAAVLAISRDDEIPYRHNNLRWIKEDLTQNSMSLHGYCVDIVVHCSPLWHLPPLVSLFAEAEATRIIAFSSTSVFTKLLSNNEFEKDLVMKLQHAEKSLAEKCAELNIRYTIFRPTTVYGVGLDVGITKLAEIIRRFGRVFVYPPAFGRRQPVHADDLSVAVLQAISDENSYDKSYNLSGGEILTYRGMLERIFAAYDKKPRIISSTFLPLLLDIIGKIRRKKQINGEIARRMNDDLVFFHDDAKNDFSFKPRKFLLGGLNDL